MKKLYRNILNDVIGKSSNLGNRKRNDRILIVDGMNTYIRTWTMSPNLNDNGDHVGGIVGFLKSIAFTVRELKPTRVIIVFDGKDGSTKRKKIYEGYKRDRGKNRFRVNRIYPENMNEEEERESMKQQFVWLAEFLESLPLNFMVYDGIEADDVMAYLSNHIKDELGTEQIIVSTDKDFLQLVDDKRIIYSPTKKILYNIPVLEKEYRLHHENFILYRILDGDSSDNIPGIYGCGLKTLLKRFPELATEPVSIDQLFSLCEERRGKIKLYDDILEAKDQIFLNKKLMSLDNVLIGTNQKMQILTKFREEGDQLDKVQFMKTSMKYGMLDSWGDMNFWLQENFGQLLYE